MTVNADEIGETFCSARGAGAGTLWQNAAGSRAHRRSQRWIWAHAAWCGAARDPMNARTGLTCVTELWSGPVCRQPCAKDADCATRCCNVASGVCQDAGYCNCAGAGNRCGATGVDGDSVACCPGNTCVGEDLEGTAFSCHQDCKTQADCASGCCSRFAPGSDRGYCRPCE
jgi:hypothetical protein